MNSQVDWETIFQGFPDGLMVTDADFTVRFVNNAFLRVIGKKAEEVLKRKCFEIFHHHMCDTPGCPLAEARSKGQLKVIDSQKHCKTANWSSWTITATPILDAEGRFSGVVEKISDALMLQKAQEALHYSQERMRKTMGAIIQAVSMTIEKRDPYTAGHQRRVTKLCRAIATELGFSWSRIQGLRMAAAIHDLGKILVPAAILNRPGPMSEPEMAIIRMHPTTAHDILSKIAFPWPLAETVYQHHERMDGSGYPRGLKGDEILLEARILAVADVVESMAFARPYRPSVGLSAAVDEIKSQRGVRYDTQVVDACLRLLLEKGFDFETKTWLRPSPQPSS